MSEGNSEISSDLGWNNLTPSWASCVTRQDLAEDFGINYKGDGWYEHNGDWVLLNKILLNKMLTGFYIRVWNGCDPRPFLIKVAEAEVRT